jgi:endogenous inhibitor of DNA gyrase (YacG/DUF329 family)
VDEDREKMKRQHPTDANRIRNKKGQYERGILPDRISVCPICGETIIQKRIFRVQKYCSKECAAAAIKKKIIKKCEFCGKPIFVKPHQKDRKKYCSKECQHKARKIPGNINDGSFKKGRDVPLEHRGLSWKNRKKGKGLYTPLEIQRDRIRAWANTPEQRQKQIEYVKNNPEKRKRICSGYTQRANRAYVIACNSQRAGSLFTGIKKENISEELIEIVRQRIIAKRILKQFKQWRKERENESGNTDVYGEQLTNEKDHEGHIQAG